MPVPDGATPARVRPPTPREKNACVNGEEDITESEYVRLVLFPALITSSPQFSASQGSHKLNFGEVSGDEVSESQREGKSRIEGIGL